MSTTEPSYIDTLVLAFKSAIYSHGHVPTSFQRLKTVEKTEADLRQALTVPRVDPEDDFLRD